MNKYQKPLCPVNSSAEHCPLDNGDSYIVKELPVKPKSLVNQINFLGMKYFGKWWVFQYFGPLYPGLLAHFSEETLLDKLLYGLKYKIHEAVFIKKISLYEFFAKIGLNEFAKKNGGICTFRIGKTPVIYQTSNVPIVKDKCLDPSTARSKRFFGDFIGTLSVDSKQRRMKRAALESVLGNFSLINKLEHEFISNIKNLLSKYEKKQVCLERFFQDIVADNGSLASGIFDFKVKPLSHYFNEFKGVTLDFFELASGIITGTEKDIDKKFEILHSFVRSVLKDNYISIDSAPESNIIKRYFKIWKLPFTLQSIEELNNEYLREIGTIIVNIFESTSLSLSWAISYIENNPSIKKRIIKESQKKIQKKCSYIDLVILEAIRIGGSNPTVLSRRVEQKFELQIGANKMIILPGTMFWLNRREANQDSTIFNNSKKFDPSNIKNIMKAKEEDIKSLVSKNRYEINSFNAINTIDSPRKCPARLYSIYTQSLIIRTLYSNYSVELKDNNIDLNPYSPMPKPVSFGTIQIYKEA